MYVLKTTEIVNEINRIKSYPLVNLDWNVDGTACLLIKYRDNKYYQSKISYDEMRLDVKSLSNLIINRVENYFNGWAVRKGYRIL